MTPDKLTDHEVIQVLRTALLSEMWGRSEGRMDEAGAVVLVHELSDKDGIIQTYIIKFCIAGDMCKEWGIFPVETGKFKNGSLIYYHDSDADVATYAALHGDGVIDPEEEV